MKKITASGPMSPDTKKLVISVLKDFNIDPNSVDFYAYNEWSTACSDECTIYVNEYLFNLLSTNAKKICYCS